MALIRRVLVGGLIAVAFALPAAAASPDSAFASKATVSGMEELELASLALGKTSNANVLSFATRMQTDHHKANQQLEGIGKSEGIALPERLTSDVYTPGFSDDTRKLKTLSGEQFDNAYMRQQVAAHKEALALFQKEAQSGKDPRLVAFAKKGVPMIKAHLALAESVLKKIPSGT